MINVLVEARVGFDQVKPWIGGSVEKDEEILLMARKPCKSWEKLPSSTGDHRISEPSTVGPNNRCIDTCIYIYSIHIYVWINKYTHKSSTSYLPKSKVVLEPLFLQGLYMPGSKLFIFGMVIPPLSRESL